MYSDDLISVIIPVYNCEKYVRQTLDSIVNQTYRNLEVLVIDDGSKDNSLAICREYLTDERVKVFPRENAGVAASRQFGVDVCRGAYFVTVDSDDYVALDYVEKLYKNWYLSTLGTQWTTLVSDELSRSSALTGIPQQADFYRSFVRPIEASGSRAYVIISDALRY